MRGLLQVLENDFVVKKLTSFKIGGSVKKVYFPTSVDEFVEILKVEPEAKVFGNLSNTLVSSDGYDGTIIITTKMCNVEFSDTRVVAESGIKGPKLSQLAEANGLSGFEFMIGFPGSLGGNICMNASANKQCISDRLLSVLCYDANGVKRYNKDQMEFSYRHSVCMDKKLVVLSAEFELEKADDSVIKEKMDLNLKFRKGHQPSLALPNCGSVFKNPEGDSAGRLLESVGAKNMSVGGVHVWENHANFIINDNNGTSLDVLMLMDKMSTAVEDKYGIKLIPEMRYLGGSNKTEEELCKKLRIESIKILK